jgi:CheY-like chemotaxis protein
MKSEQETENLPVVVFTTSSAAHDEAFCKKFGVPMVTKPQTLEEIKSAVDVLLSFITAAA